MSYRNLETGIYRSGLKLQLPKNKSFTDKYKIFIFMLQVTLNQNSLLFSAKIIPQINRSIFLIKRS